MQENINFSNTNLTDEQIKRITEAVTKNYNDKKGIQVIQISPGTLVLTNNNEPYSLNEKELEALRLFLDSIFATYDVLKDSNNG